MRTTNSSVNDIGNGFPKIRLTWPLKSNAYLRIAAVENINT